MRTIFLAALLMLLVSCDKNIQKFAEKNAKDFVPKTVLKSPVIIAEHDIVLFPVSKNFITRSGRKLQIVMEENYSSSAGSSLSDEAIVNYEIRSISSAGKSFRKIFPEDCAVIDCEMDNEDGYDGSVRLPFMSFILIDEDTNMDDIIDDVNDVRSLYIYGYSRGILKKISPPAINVYQNSQQFVNAGKNGSPGDYSICFSGEDMDGKVHYYLYSFGTEKLEQLDNHFTEKYEIE